ncbi:FHA domain-containing protein [Agreia sp.]|uniref:FHA domain-containing protein n=1 Tax=Agreia sp. TaxID=1872416 RepID=UPI0035BC0D5E
MTTVDGGGVGVHVGTRVTRVEWHAPVSLHVYADVTDPQASQLRRSSDGAVQLMVGAEVTVHVWLQDAAGPVWVRVGEIVGGVTSIELEAAPSDDDDTVAHADGIVGAGDVQPRALTRAGNDIDDTILGQPAFALSGDQPRDEPDDEPIDDTILGQAPATRVDVDDPDASADTIIGAGRNRPPLPAIPSVPASAHVNAGLSPMRSRRTRVEPAEASGESVGTIAVSFPDGRIVALDRPVYVGRSPKSPRITSGVAPELVAVASPRREVSSTHLELQQEGRAVVVRDLGSTNGTRVSVPGAAQSLLSPGASRVVAAGTLLDLGDDIVLEIVAPIGIARTGSGNTTGSAW